MKRHLVTAVVLLLALACYAVGLTGPGLVLSFVGATLAIAIWLRTVQAPRRSTARLVARLTLRR